MKILITENQLEKIVNRFLDLELKGLKRTGNIYYIKKGMKDVEIMSISSVHNIFFIEDWFWRPIMEMFQLDYYKTKEIIEKWVRNNLDIGDRHVNLY